MMRQRFRIRWIFDGILYPNVENMQSGLAGICAGLIDSVQASRTVQGIAIYAAWEAETTDWQLWDAWQQ